MTGLVKVVFVPHWASEPCLAVTWVINISWPDNHFTCFLLIWPPCCFPAMCIYSLKTSSFLCVWGAVVINTCDCGHWKAAVIGSQSVLLAKRVYAAHWRAYMTHPQLYRRALSRQATEAFSSGDPRHQPPHWDAFLKAPKFMVSASQNRRGQPCFWAIGGR